jgi:hypothetical protein
MCLILLLCGKANPMPERDRHDQQGELWDRQGVDVSRFRHLGQPRTKRGAKQKNLTGRHEEIISKDKKRLEMEWLP